MTVADQQQQDFYMALPSHKSDMFSREYSKKTHNKRSVWSVILMCVALVCILSIPAAYFNQAPDFIKLRAPRATVQVYTREQATRAAKAAVAQLQLIEQRRPFAAGAANPMALPKTKETDLSSERRL